MSGHATATVQLCNSHVDELAYSDSITALLVLARQLDEQVVEHAARERELDRAAEEVAAAKDALDAAIEARDRVQLVINEFQDLIDDVDFAVDTFDDVGATFGAP